MHDPSIIKQGGTWYLFGTATEKGPHAQLPMRCSNDLEHWKRCGAVFAGIPDWIQKESPETKDLWAPDVSYFSGKYHVYYAFSAFGKNTSGIALVTNKTLDQSSPDFHWVDEGLVLTSLASDDFNAIDPEHRSRFRWYAVAQLRKFLERHQNTPPRRLHRKTLTARRQALRSRQPRAPR